MSLNKYNVEIIDPHIHYWNPYTTPRSVTPAVKLFGRFPRLLDRIIRMAQPQETIDYFGNTTLFTNSYLPPVHLDNTAPYRVTGVVHVQADWQAKEPVDFANETAWLDSLDRPPMGIVGEARLNDVANLEAVLDAHEAASPRFRGIRDMLAYHPSKGIHNFNEREEMMTTDPFRQGFARLGQRGLSYDAFVFSHQLPMLCDLVESVPKTAVVLNHVGSPIGLGGPFANEFGLTPPDRLKIEKEWHKNMKRLAQSSHVYVKLSGLFMHILGWHHLKEWQTPITATQAVSFIGEHIQFVIDTFGPERCMFASNFPPDLVLIDFPTLYDAYFTIVADMDQATHEALFAKTARRFYRLTD